MAKGLTFCIVVLQKLKNKTKTYSLIDMHHQKDLKRVPNTTNLVDMPKGLTFCIVVLQKLKNKTKTYSLIDMHHQKDLNRYTPIFKPHHTVQPKLNRKNKKR